MLLASADSRGFTASGRTGAEDADGALEDDNGSMEGARLIVDEAGLELLPLDDLECIKQLRM